MLNLAAPRKGRFSIGFPFYAMGSFFFLIAWLVPNHYPPWVGFHNEAAMFAALILFFAGSITDPKSVWLPFPTQATFIGLIAMVWLQWAGGLIYYRGDALVSSLFLAGTGLAWWFGVRTVLARDTPERVTDCAAMLIVSAAVISSYMAVVQWLNLETDWWFYIAERGPNRPYANLGQPNLLATLLVMGVVFSYLLYLRQRIKTWHLLALTVHLSFGLVVTESRAGFLSAFCVGLFLLLRARPGCNVGNWRVVALWWGLLAGFSILWRPLNAVVLQQTAREPSLTVDNARLVIWKQVIAAISHAPWLGYGWRQTVVAQKIGVEVIPGDLPTDYAHSVVLDVLAWLGLPLGILLLLLGAWWVLRTILDLKDSTEFMLFTATIPFLVHSMVEFPFAYAYFLFPIAWIFGFLHARQLPGQFQVSSAAPWIERIATIVGLCGFAVLCGLVALEYLEAEEDFRVMRFEMHRVGARPVDYQAPHLVLLTQLDDLLNMGRMQPSRGMPMNDIEHLRRANLSRHWGALNMKYVVALGINGQPDEATKQLRNIKALYGSELYRSAAEELRALRDKKYPELALVKIE